MGTECFCHHEFDSLAMGISTLPAPWEKHTALTSTWEVLQRVSENEKLIHSCEVGQLEASGRYHKEEVFLGMEPMKADPKKEKRSEPRSSDPLGAARPEAMHCRTSC